MEEQNYDQLQPTNPRQTRRKWLNWLAEEPTGTLTYSTNEGLVVSGATALFTVYVVLTTLNEKGSNTVGVTRP